VPTAQILDESRALRGEAHERVSGHTFHTYIDTYKAQQHNNKKTYLTSPGMYMRTTHTCIISRTAHTDNCTRCSCTTKNKTNSHNTLADMYNAFV